MGILWSRMLHGFHKGFVQIEKEICHLSDYVRKLSRHHLLKC